LGFGLWLGIYEKYACRRPRLETLRDDRAEEFGTPQETFFIAKTQQQRFKLIKCLLLIGPDRLEDDTGAAIQIGTKCYDIAVNCASEIAPDPREYRGPRGPSGVMAMPANAFFPRGDRGERHGGRLGSLSMLRLAPRDALRMIRGL
jgi:hypothetical protein